VGGHTIEGPQVTIGFTVLASQLADPPLTKGGLRPGDQLVLTKALGTGVLLAAHMRARCRAEWFAPLLGSMLQSNGPPAVAAMEYGIDALTDVTGFGLGGHLLEMLKASDASADLDLSAIRLLPGAAALLGEGIESTMAAGNRDVETEIAGGDRRSAAYQVLFDPQTGGGLLIGVPSGRTDALLSRLAALGCEDARVIGTVAAPAADRRRIRIT
jgi:selenide,water dikinase